MNADDVSSIPPIIPYGGFSPSTAGRLAFRCAFPVAAALKSAPDIRVATSGLPSPFVHFVTTRLSRTESGRLTRSCTAMKWIHHNPRGPRSGSGCSVPNFVLKLQDFSSHPANAPIAYPCPAVACKCPLARLPGVPASERN